MNYTPEMECPDIVKDALLSLQAAWFVLRDDENPFSNTGAKYIGDKFEVYAYSYGDEEQPHNFRWRDVTVSWHKYMGIGTTINRVMSKEEIHLMLKECLLELLGVDNTIHK